MASQRIVTHWHARCKNWASVKLFVLGKAQCFHEYIHTTFKLREMLTLSLKFLVLRARNDYYFGGDCLEVICLFHVLIMPYMYQKVFLHYIKKLKHVKILSLMFTRVVL